MRFDIITLFPTIFSNYFAQGVLTEGIKTGLLEVVTHDLREYGLGNYKQVDDRTFGGGAGMLLRFEPIKAAIDHIRSEYARLGIEKSLVIATTAGGEVYKQSLSRKLLTYDGIILLCGRYEGFDQRILDELVDMEISLGNFVLTGGEIPALAIIDSISRQIPGVLNKQESFTHDSFYEDDATVQYPQYTRPEVIDFEGRELRVPSILLSGNHAEIEAWRKSQQRRPVSD